MSPVELPTVPAASAPAEASRPVASISRERYEELARRVRLLSWLSLGWMTVEGAVAITAGIVASSIALVGFGLDSGIEGVASLIIVWRFTGHRVFSHAAEERAQKLVAVQFFLLAPYVGFESVRALIGAEHPEVSWSGLASRSHRWSSCRCSGSPRNSSPTSSARQRRRARAARTCSAPTWPAPCWSACSATPCSAPGGLDPAVGLLIAAVAVREGREAWRGEGCCVSSPLDGASFAGECCDDDCCEGCCEPTA